MTLYISKVLCDERMAIMASINNFKSMITIAKENAKKHTVDLAEVSPKIAETISAYKRNINKEQFLQGVNKVATESKEIVLPSAETLRAYHGIDAPIQMREIAVKAMELQNESIAKELVDKILKK